MKFCFLILLSLFLGYGWSQVVFSEPFDEADDAITGVDNTAGLVTWTTTCPGSMAATDYFKVVAGQLEGRDTNSPEATITTDDINIVSCLDGLTISLDISEDGAMEGCADCGGSGTICVDYVRLQYNLDGGGWTDVAGTACPATMTEVPGLVIQDGEIPGGGPITFTSPCIDIGTTLQVRVTCKSWAASEYWRIDNLTVTCTSCVLPAEIEDFLAEHKEGVTHVKWSTLSELNTDFFTVERSYDGTYYELIEVVPAAGTSNEKIDYEILDREVPNTEVVYYRLKQYDQDGNTGSAQITSVKLAPHVKLFFTGNELNYTLPAETEAQTLSIFNMNGQLIRTVAIQGGTGTIPWNDSGVFIALIPELNYRTKLTF